MLGTVQRLWWMGLTLVLAICYFVIGITAGGAIAMAAILGAVLIASTLAIWSRSKPAAAALLVVGALPLGLLTWWSVITPILVVLALVCGGLAIRTAVWPTRIA
jgi:hypothetical protein